MKNYTLLLALTTSLAILISALSTGLVRKLALHFRAIDVPDNDRKIHSQPMPLWGGVALYVSVALTFLFVLFFEPLGYSADIKRLIAGFLIAGFVLVAGGMIDDKKNLSWKTQLLFPVIATIIMLFFGLEISFISSPNGGVLQINEWQVTAQLLGYTATVSPVADILLFLWILGMIYTTKLLDGIDGLATSISAVAAMVLFVVSLFWDRSGSITSFGTLIVAGACVGFLIWNFHPAKIFLGESGSTFLGFSLAVLSVLSGGKIATALLVMGIPILDVAITIVRRLKSREKIYTADTRHLHFRLLNIGLSQPQIVILLSGIALLFGSISFFARTKVKIIALVILCVAVLIFNKQLTHWHEKKHIPK